MNEPLWTPHSLVHKNSIVTVLDVCIFSSVFSAVSARDNGTFPPTVILELIVKILFSLSFFLKKLLVKI